MRDLVRLQLYADAGTYQHYLGDFCWLLCRAARTKKYYVDNSNFISFYIIGSAVYCTSICTQYIYIYTHIPIAIKSPSITNLLNPQVSQVSYAV